MDCSKKKRLEKAASILVAAPQYKGIAVPSNILTLKIPTATRLNNPDATQPIDPKTLILGYCSEDVCVMAIVLVRLHEGM